MLLLALPLAAAAQPPIAPRAPAPAADDSRLGSVFVRCDGAPDHHSPAELAARIVAIIATAGLAGPGEMPDANKRLTGADGVAACDAALAGEGDRTRRIELTLGRAAHQIEAKNFDAALADARSVPGLAGDESADFAYQHSLALSAMDLEASALARLGRGAEAEQVALQMANAAPYDLTAQLGAVPFVGLTDQLTPQKRAFYDRLGRIWPQGLLGYADADDWAGDYAGAAAETQALIAVYTAFISPDHPLPPQVALKARAAVELAMAGQSDASGALAAQAHADIDAMVASGAAANNQNVVESAGELLDFQAITAQVAAGHVAEARAAFAARSRWLAVPPAIVAALSTRLRDGAPPEALTGALARDPAALRAEALAARAGSISQSPNADANLWTAIRWPLKLEAYTLWSGQVWKADHSPFLPKKTGKETYQGDLVFIPQFNTMPYEQLQGVPVAEALLMHCALVAKARGKAGFVMTPGRTRLNWTVVRFGDPAELGVPASAMVDAQTVIDALSPEFPDPRAR